ncbi:hypothetical protein JW835_11465 [bacterium]|nr:hypothetical protein [bacterium]
MEPVIISFAILTLLVIIFIASIRNEKKRTETLKQKAGMRGFTFQDKAGLEVIPLSNEFHLFSRGHSKRVQNFMQKSGLDSEEAIFDYIYTTGSGKNRSIHRQTVYLFHSDRLHLPVFAVRPEHVFHKIRQIFGYQDIDFKQYPEFSKKFILRGKDEAAIDKIFTQDVIACFLHEKKLCVESAGKDLIIYWSGKRIKPNLLFKQYETVRKVYQILQQRSQFV